MTSGCAGPRSSARPKLSSVFSNLGYGIDRILRQPASWNTGVCEAPRIGDAPSITGGKRCPFLLGEISARLAPFAAPSRRDGNLKMSGVLPTDKCKAEFAVLREKRAYKFITFKIDATGTMTDVCDVCPTSVRSNNARDGRERRAYP